MRKTNIDELPQFINVLKGDMPVVGPRPHMLAHTDMYSNLIDQYMVRHFVKPVVTKRIRHSRGLTTYNDIYHGDCIQLIDHKWLHFINGSNCAKIPGKEKLVNKMIDNIESLKSEV